MADLITNPIGQDMVQAAQGGVGGMPDPSTQVAANQTSDQQRPKGTVQDQREATLSRDPNARLPATPNMQAQYTQLVTRFLLFVHDLRQKPVAPGQSKQDHHRSPAELFINQMNNPKLPVADAVGRATANALFILHNSAKQQKVSYNPNVMFRAADECVIAMYLLGNARGIFNGVPAFKGKQAGVPYKLDPSEKLIILRAKMAAVQWFGSLMQKSGQISPKERQAALQHWQQQIKQEVAQGKVTDSQVQNILQKSHFADHLQNQGGPDSQNASLDNSTGVAPNANPQPPQTQSQPSPGQQPPTQMGAS